MHSTKVEPKYNLNPNPRIGLIALATDFMIEKDFINVTKNMDIELFVNRIHCYSPLTSGNLIKMSNTITEVSKDILPDEKLDCVVYGCTSGTIAAGYDSIKKKIELAKPEAKVTTPSTAASNALKKLNVSKVAIFTPYSKKLNDEVVDYFKEEDFIVTSNSYFDISIDSDIAKVDPNYLFNVVKSMELEEAEADFVSCTNLPALSIIDKLEKKLNKIVLCSNQVLIWDTLNLIKNKSPFKGFGRIFEVN
jgi:maleate isomerase